MSRRGAGLAMFAAGLLAAAGCSHDPGGSAGDRPDGGPAPDGAPLTGPCAPDADVPESGLRTVTVGGQPRSFLLHVPAGYDRAATPLVLNVHGFTSSPEQQEYFSDMSRIADREGFAVAYPAGTGTPASFNAGACCGQAVENEVDDVAFAAAVIDAASEELCVDPARVYSTGLSNGGFLSYRLACELSDRIAAIAPVAGVMGIADCAPSRAVPVLHFHGTDDLLVPFEGSSSFGFPSVEDTVAGWAERDGCTGEPDVTFQEGDSTCRRWTACAEGAAVELCVVEDGGHTWPGGRVPAAAGKTTQDLVASDRMWEFFAEHPMPGR